MEALSSYFDLRGKTLLLKTPLIASSSTVGDANSVSERLADSFTFLQKKLRDNLKPDPFKRLGKWCDFLTNKVYVAVFVHPDPSSAYQVYEVINTRGKELTTADLLKNYVLSQTAPAKRGARYQEWKRVSSQFTPEGANTFVQFIRHVVTVQNGHILPKDLFAFLAARSEHSDKQPPSPDHLMHLLEAHQPLYMQMVDPTLAGPAEPEALRIFSALNSLSVIAVRPILLAVADTPDPIEGMKYILRLVVRRIVVGNLGTGNVERRFGEAARKVREAHNWSILTRDLKDLNPTKDEFEATLVRRSFNKSVLTFLRRSIIASSITPEPTGELHFIWSRQATQWQGMSEEDGSFWASTIGNTYLADLERRPKNANSWDGFKEYVLPHGVLNEWQHELGREDEWNAGAVERMGQQLAWHATNVWYPQDAIIDAP